MSTIRKNHFLLFATAIVALAFAVPQVGVAKSVVSLASPWLAGAWDRGSHLGSRFRWGALTARSITVWVCGEQ